MTRANDQDYRFALLQPSNSADAANNHAVLGEETLGIEVTEQTLAARCDLGNIDPQHGGVVVVQCSAIDLALDWPLPPGGSTLATLKPDADALGAMAVLALRRQGVKLGTDALDRVRLVSRWDRFDLGDWLTWRDRHPPLPHPACPGDLDGPPLELRAVRALAADSRLQLADRVAALAGWIASGKLPEHFSAIARDHEAELLGAWNSGNLTVSLSSDPRLAILTARERAGLFLGYRHAPVVLAESGTGEAKAITIAQFEPGWIDLADLLTAISAAEPGWGGGATIIASPQGAGTAMEPSQILALALRALGPRLLH